MKSKALALILLAALLLSGCASKKGNDDNGPSGTASGTATGSVSASTTKSSSGSSTGGPSNPGAIAVNFTRATPNGPVPLDVNFTLDATYKTAAGKPAAPETVSWKVKVTSGNSTNSTTTDGPQGTTLPASFTLNFTAVGNHTVWAEVAAPGYTTANATILVSAIAGGPGVPMFFDGAEGDASQWTTSSKVLVTNIAPAPTTESTADHPGGKWELVTTEHQTGAKSWHVAYPDNIRARMTSVAIPIPTGASPSLTYSLKGGAEGTPVEGLFVLVGPAGGALAEVAHHSGVAMDWTTFTVPVPAAAGQSIEVQFRFDSDVSCSSSPAASPPADPAGLCGPGYNAGGYWIDDIKVA